MPADSTPVRGDLLSCYTASIAEYMAGAGLDHELAIGTQAFLAVRPAPTDSGALEFIQFHTPLRGETPTHRLWLQRRHTADEREARERIAAEIDRAGRAIVVGDTFNIPWQVAHGKRHAPHWFIADGLDLDAGRVHVTDRFEFVNDDGEQRPFDGWVALDDLPALARVNPDPAPVLAMRDRHAFADAEDPERIARDGYQWYELDGQPDAAAPGAAAQGAALALERLSATQRHGSGAARPVACAPDGWVTGPAAAERLADHAEAHIGDKAMYANSDDVWVTGRNRQLFAVTLGRLAERYRLPALAELAAWCESEVAAAWLTAPQLMQYNLRSLDRGRTPRPLLAEQLRKAAAAERTLVDRLGETLAGIPSPDPNGRHHTTTTNGEANR